MANRSAFGTCCNDLSEAMTQPPNSFFVVADDGVLYMTIGYVMTDRGPGFFDHAVLFCPFCGTALQTSEEISRRQKP